MMNERSNTRKARERAILWLLRRLKCSRNDAKVHEDKEAGCKWYNAVKWKKGDNDEKDEEEISNRPSQVGYPCEDFEREAYIGRRISIGSVERNDATILFNILDDLKDFKDTTKTKVNLGRLQRHILARYGDSR